MAELSEMLGRTLTSITGADIGSDRIRFTAGTGGAWEMHHSQDCCESVSVHQIDGDIDDLLGEPLLMAEEVESEVEPCRPEHAESYTWTFYKLATVKGYVTIRWLGSSSGYYSESVDFRKVEPSE